MNTSSHACRRRLGALVLAAALSAPMGALAHDLDCIGAPVGQWKLDENSGTIAHDAVGANDGTVAGGVTWTVGFEGSALTFAPASGAQAVVVDPVDSALNLTSNLSIAFWVKPTQWSQNRYLGLVTYSNGGNDQYYVGITPGGNIYFTYYASGYRDTFGPTGWQNAAWQHVVVNVKTSSNAVEFWRDGALVQTSTRNFAAVPIPSHAGAKLYIGLNPGEDYEFNGIIDEVSVFNRTLTADEIAVLLEDTCPDSDGDGVPNDADNCTDVSNADQTDTDLDSLGDACDADDDADGVADTTDNCQFTVNAGQTDLDGDGAGDACDADPDGDGFLVTDNCPLVPNADQTDTDGDGHGDDCDADDDEDGICDAGSEATGCAAGPDNCPTVPNGGQADLDGDAVGDACDADTDGDGIANVTDTCPLVADPSNDNTDGDGQGDACDDDDDDDSISDLADNCRLIANDDQADTDGDGNGDACDDDLDGDDVPNFADNCADIPNSGQTDIDADGSGDACDPDIDGDGVANPGDACASTPEGAVVNAAGCSVAQLCPCSGPQGSSAAWRNHGKYVSCVAGASNQFVTAGLMTQAEKDATVSAAGQSNCGQ